jgi:hypothetical protein
MASMPHCQSVYVFSLTSQARFPTQGTRRTAHSKKPLHHKSCRRCLYKRGSLFAHIASSRGLCQNIGLLRRGINAMDWSDFAMESFESVSADQKQHIMDLPASWSPIGISKKWRVCPLFVSMWLCLFSRASVSEEARNKAVATPRCFVMALREAKKNHNGHPRQPKCSHISAKLVEQRGMSLQHIALRLLPDILRLQGSRVSRIVLCFASRECRGVAQPRCIVDASHNTCCLT